jgi:hypothetical protein
MPGTSTGRRDSTCGLSLPLFLSFEFFVVNPPSAPLVSPLRPVNPAAGLRTDSTTAILLLS